jgi:hypothetical protein
MKEITTEIKYEIACEMLADFVGGLLKIESFLTAELVDEKISFIVEHGSISPEELNAMLHETGSAH